MPALELMIFGTYDLSILETASHFNSEKSVRIMFEEF